jgi:hypothetical protein
MRRCTHDSGEGKNTNLRNHTGSPRAGMGKETKKFPYGQSPFLKRVCDHMGSNRYVSVPTKIVEQNKIVTLVADVFFVDGIAFLLSVSRQIMLITAEHVTIRMARSLSKHLA